MFYSPTWKSQLGYRDEDLASSLETWEKLVHPDDRAPTLHQVEAYLAGDTEIFEIPMRMRHRDGHWVHILSRGSLVRGHDGSPSMPRRLVGLHVDLTAFKKMQADVLESETRFRTLFEKAMTGMAVADPKGNLTEANEQLARLLGYSRGELLGKNISAFTHPEDLASELVFLQEISNDLRDDYRIEKRYVTRSGEILWVDLLVTVLRDQERKATSVIGLVVDITERKASETRIIHLAYYDPLTDLPNRRLMQERLAHAVSTSERQGMFGALLMIDLDNFKTLNDTLGHDIGDQLLIQAAQRLRRCVRDSDTVSRLGGDEFMVILEHLDVRELAAIHSAEIVAAKILSEFSVAYSLELGVSSLGNSSRNHFCSCSIGITLFYGRGVKTEELLKRADTAMYQAKSAGRNRVCFFDPQMQATVNARLAMETDIRQALLSESFALHYQPQVDQLGKVLGAEALLRWPLRDGGFVSPMDFIPVAETTGLILPISKWVLRSACETLFSWSLQPATANLTLAVNISAIEMHQDDFVDQVLGSLKRSGAPAHRLKLELTESLLVKNMVSVKEKMLRLKAHGVGFALDDFGTGYSSLSYLKLLPLDQLKIDKSFVRDVLSDPNDASIARTIVSLGQGLNLAVIAEGVETAAQREFLAGIGCINFQGYHCGRPMPLNDFNQWISENTIDFASG